jgi:hydrogen peroxide-dependent heme synthase
LSVRQDMTLPVVKLDQGLHVLHAFYRVDRVRWAQLPAGQSQQCLSRIGRLCEAHPGPSHPRLTTHVNVGGKADLAFLVLAAELGQLSRIHRDLEDSFPPGTLQPVYSYLSVTELPEYVTTEEDIKQSLAQQEKLEPGTEAYQKRFEAMRQRQAEYRHYRLYPELPDWEVMAFYPMSKRRHGADNWYRLDFPTRKQLMAGHARVGRKFAGRITQLITGSTGLDDWEWGVTLMAHQADALKEIVYEMRFDEVSARYADFGPFYVNLRNTFISDRAGRMTLSPTKKMAVVAGSVLALDQLTKLAVLRYLGYAQEKVIIPGFFKFVHWGNPGAAWSLFNQFSGSNQLLAVFALAALLVLFFTRHHFDSDTLLGQMSLGLIFGGIVGNLTDRFVHGFVVDFIYFYLLRRGGGELGFPAFNIADSAICTGVGLLFLLSWQKDQASAAAAHQSANPG